MNVRVTTELHRRRVVTSASVLQVVTQAIFGLGGPEIAVIAGVAVLIFGTSCFMALKALRPAIVRT